MFLLYNRRRVKIMTFGNPNLDPAVFSTRKTKIHEKKNLTRYLEGKSCSLGFLLWGWFSRRVYSGIRWYWLWRGTIRRKFHFCRRPFVAVLAPAAFSLEGSAAPTRLIASSRPCVYVFLEPIKTLRFPNFFPTLSNTEYFIT